VLFPLREHRVVHTRTHSLKKKKKEEHLSDCNAESPKQGGKLASCFPHSEARADHVKEKQIAGDGIAPACCFPVLLLIYLSTYLSIFKSGFFVSLPLRRRVGWLFSFAGLTSRSSDETVG
jgi:hypothetical protein